VSDRRNNKQCSNLTFYRSTKYSVEIVEKTLPAQKSVISLLAQVVTLKICLSLSKRWNEIFI